MSNTNTTPGAREEALTNDTVTYEGVRAVITREGPRHYRVTVSEPEGDTTRHAVECVAINATDVRFEDSIWFADVNLDVGVPVDGHGDTAWVWS